MSKRTHLVSLCLTIVVAIVGVCISLRGIWYSWGMLVYLGKFDALPGQFDSVIKSELSSSEHMFVSLFIGFSIVLVLGAIFLADFILKRNEPVA
jgi:zinc transporter ZupT